MLEVDICCVDGSRDNGVSALVADFGNCENDLEFFNLARARASCSKPACTGFRD